MSIKEVDITPDPSLISKLGASGYRTYEALAELIDNSIDARIENTKLIIRVEIDFIKETITISDDGHGMNFETLKNAMVLAHTRKINSLNTLGVYGLGLKTACASLGKNFEILTKPTESKMRYSCSYNEDDWLNSDREIWKHFIINSENWDEAYHGTIIKIEKLKANLYRPLVGILVDAFEFRYGLFIKTDQVNLYINSRKCAPKEDKIIEDTKIEFAIPLSDDKVVTGWGALLEKRQGAEYGFNLFKNKRLIKMHDKGLFGREEHSLISLIVGELNLDHIPTLYNKTDFLKDSPEFKEFAEAFIKYEPFLELKREAIKPKHAKEITDATREKIRSITKTFLKQLDSIEKGNYEFPKEEFKAGKDYKIIDENINVQGKKRRLIIKLVYKPDLSIKNIKGTKDTIEIDINQNSFPYRHLKDKTAFVNMQIAEAISYHIAKENNLSIDDLFKLNDNFISAGLMEINRKPFKKQTDLKTENQDMLVDELKEVNSYLLKEKSFKDDEYYFTATAVLESYLTHIPTVSYYFLYAEPGLGEKIQNCLIEKFEDKFLVVLNPKKLDSEYFSNVIKNTKLNKIIIVKEKEREEPYKKEGSVAPLEMALGDLLFEIRKNNLPVSLDDIETMVEDLNMSGKLQKLKLKRYVSKRSKTDWNLLKKALGS